jgi:hypothetical protein
MDNILNILSSLTPARGIKQRIRLAGVCGVSVVFALGSAMGRGSRRADHGQYSEYSEFFESRTRDSTENQVGGCLWRVCGVGLGSARTNKYDPKQKQLRPSTT